MPTTQIADVLVPQLFTEYQIEQSIVSTALYQSGVLVKNGAITDALAAGAQSFTVPFWRDLGEQEADITSDDPNTLAVPQKFSTGRQTVRKSFLHASWSSMDLASELAGSNPIEALQDRVSAYWDRQYERRLISTFIGLLNSNVANNAADMVYDISAQSGSASAFSATAVINTALTNGDHLSDFKAIAMHSSIYGTALKNDLIQFIPQSQGLPIATYRGMACLVDDNLSQVNGNFVTVLMGLGCVGFGAAEPNVAPGTEVSRNAAAGNGGGQSTLHSRVNVGLHPLGFAWSDGTGANAIAGASPSISDLAVGAHWTRSAASRKSVPLAFLITKS